ncbi:MAG: hypothetical protein I3J02_07580 [Prevotella sp.]|nr:hypothetical protein [Prevotella sp.]
MKRNVLLFCVATLMAILGQKAYALDSSWTEVTSLPTTTAEMANNYYVFVEQNSGSGLMLQLADANYNVAGYQSLYFKTAIDDPTTDMTYVFTLEYADGKYGVRNVQNSTYMLQTEYRAAWYLRTHDQPNIVSWTEFTFAYDATNGYWTIQNGMYPESGYWGPWETEAFADGSELAANKQGTDIAHFKIYQKSKGSELEQAKTSYNIALSNAKAVDQAAAMQGDLLTALQTAITTYGNVTSDVVADYTDAAAALTSATNDATASIKAYTNATNVLPKMQAFCETTNFYTVDAYNTYYATPQGKYDDRTMTTDEANALQDPNAYIAGKYYRTVPGLLLSTWDGVGYYINTWSGEGTWDGSNVTVPFFEYFAGTSGTDTLAAKTLTGTMTGLEPGTYTVSVLVRLCSNDTKAVGASIQANDGEIIDLTQGAQGGNIASTYTTYGTYTAMGTVGADGQLVVKINIAEGNNIGWLAFKNVTYAKVDDTMLYTRTKTSTGWGTVCLPYAATATGNTEVYTVSGISADKTKLALAKATTMTAGVPYLYYNGSADATFVESGSAVSAPVAGDNTLTGLFDSAAGSVANGAYIMKNGNWYKVDNANVFNLGNNRAYIANLDAITVVDAAAAAKTMSVDLNAVTAITSVQTAVGKTEEFNLAGQRVDGSYKGIVISNGHKLIRK